MPRKLTYEEYIKRLKEKWGNKYDYSKIDKNNFTFSETSYEYKCNIHNIWFTKTCKSMCRDKNCCPKCKKEALNKQINIIQNRNRSLDKKRKYYHLDEFLEITKERFPSITINLSTIRYNQGNFSNGHHICLNKLIECDCKKHGKFKCFPISFINKKYVCPRCRKNYSNLQNVKHGENRRNSFVESARKIHGNKYDYSLVNTSGRLSKIEIVCPIHGSFMQMPSMHLRGEGCPICAKGLFVNGTSPNEQRLLTLLKEKFNNLIFENGYRNKEIFGRQSLDIYNDKYKFAIEYQGQQHFEENKYLNSDSHHSLENRKKLDLRKYNLCMTNGIKLFYFTFNKKFENIKYFDKVYTNIEELFSEIQKYIQFFFWK
ncbi:MAG: zinc ribbon domain-containing protein [Erysipelotrichales bacterium]|nr:zinc ribbon domain-containing protein [Erysipelotrichales bacterium]